MKQILFISLIFLFLSAVSFAQEPFRTKGRVNLHAGLGFGLYLLSTNQIEDKDGATLAGILRIGADYGLGKRFSLGLVLFRNGFATSKDSSERAQNSGLGLYCNFNFWLRPKTTWYGSVGLGASTLNYENFKNSGKATSGAGYVMAGLGMRRYFGNHFGFFAQIDLPSYQFKKLEFKNKDSALQTNNRWEMSLSGVEVKTGVIYAFGKN